MLATFPGKEGETSNFADFTALEDPKQKRQILAQICDAMKERFRICPEAQETYVLILNKQSSELMLVSEAAFLRKSFQVNQEKQGLKKSLKRKTPTSLIMEAEMENSCRKKKPNGEDYDYNFMKASANSLMLDKEPELTLTDLLEAPVPKIDGLFLPEEAPLVKVKPLITAERWPEAISSINYSQDVIMKPLDLSCKNTRYDLLQEGKSRVYQHSETDSDSSVALETSNEQLQKPATELAEAIIKNLRCDKQNNQQS